MADCKGVCFWFTGLSGSGKTATALALADLVEREQVRPVELFDGDVVRSGYHRPLGFSKDDRDANVLRVAGMAVEVVSRGGVAICAMVSPYRDSRAEAKRKVGPDRFVEVYVATPLWVCEGRDPKGLYARARAGLILGFTGVSDPYEPPCAPDVTLDWSGFSGSNNTIPANARKVADFWHWGK